MELLMKSLNKLVSSFFIYLALILPAHAGLGVTLVADTWPPYIDANLPENGMASEIVTTALTRAGYEPKIQIENWMRVLEGGELGIYDAIIAAWHRPERAEKFIYSDPYYVNEIRLIKLKGTDFDFRDIYTVPGLVAGYIEGYAYNEKIKRPDNILLVPSNHVVQNLLKLNNGQIDFTLGDEGVLRYQIEQYFSNNKDKFDIDQEVFAERKLYFMVSKLNPRHGRIIEDFNKELAKMKKDGTYQAILKKHRY
jgi:polar amino acid transport system substrate-binding protein